MGMVSGPWAVVIASAALALLALSGTVLPFQVAGSHGFSHDLAPKAGRATAGAAPPVSTAPALGNCTFCAVANITKGVAKNPNMLAYDPANGEVYATGTDNSSVTVIDGSTNTVVTTLLTGGSPVGISYDALDGDLYVSCENSTNLTVIDGATNSLAPPITFSFVPGWVATDSRDGLIYVGGAGGVYPVNPGNGSIGRRIAVGLSPWGITYDPVNDYLYVADNGGNNITVISATLNRTIASVNVGSAPSGVLYDPANGDIYVANYVSHNVSVIRDTSLVVPSQVYVPGPNPRYLTYDAADADIFVTDEQGGDIAVINGTSQTVLRDIILGAGNCCGGGTIPNGITYDLENGDIYVAMYASPYDVEVVAPTSNLTGIQVVPPSAVVGVGRTIGFNATAGCLPSPCPWVPYYTWALSSTALGTLNSSNGGWVDLTVGFTLGGLILTVNVTDHGERLFAPVVSVIVVPGIAAVTIGPAAVKLNVGNGTSFSATPTCTGGPCPSGTNFTWSATQGVGTFLPGPGPSTSPVVEFKAGAVPVTESIFVNATLDGTTVQSGPVTVTIDANLTTVSVAPSSLTVSVGGTSTFTASVFCAAGPCPSGENFAWALTNPQGSLGVNIGRSVMFTAGSTAGTDTLFVNVSLNGNLVGAAPVTVTIVPQLSAASVTPSPAIVPLGGKLTFQASIQCLGGGCPTGATYSWSLTNNLLGTLSSSTAPLDPFTAGSNVGVDTLYLNVTLGAVTVAASPVQIDLVPALNSVDLSPLSTALQTGASQNFVPTLGCFGGACPGGASYAWTLTNPSAALNSSIAPTVTVIAGLSAGSDQLFLNVTLDGVVVAASSATILISLLAPTALKAVSLSPSDAMLQVGSALTINATPLCTYGNPCPADVVYSWSVNNTLGWVGAGSGPSIVFTARGFAGLSTLTVHASLGTAIVNGTAALTISTAPVPALLSVVGSPSTASVTVQGSQTLTASATCTPSPCPGAPFLTYSWSETGVSASLSPTGPSATFTASTMTGVAVVTVVASLNGVAKNSTMSLTVVSNSPGKTPGGTTGFWTGHGVILGLLVLAILVILGAVLVLRRRRSPSSPGRRTPAVGAADAAYPEPSTTPSSPAAGLGSPGTSAPSPFPSSPPPPGPSVRAPPPPAPGAPSSGPAFAPAATTHPGAVPSPSQDLRAPPPPPPASPTAPAPSPAPSPVVSAAPTVAAASVNTGAAAAPPQTSPPGAFTVFEATSRAGVYARASALGISGAALLVVSPDNPSTLAGAWKNDAVFWRLARTEQEGTVRPDEVDRLGSILERHLSKAPGQAVLLLGMEEIIDATSLRVARRLVALLREVAEGQGGHALLHLNPSLLDESERRVLEEGATVLRD